MFHQHAHDQEVDDVAAAAGALGALAAAAAYATAGLHPQPLQLQEQEQEAAKPQPRLTKSGAERRPLHFWAEFNEWWRQEFERTQARPSGAVIKAWCVFEPDLGHS